VSPFNLFNEVAFAVDEESSAGCIK